MSKNKEVSYFGSSKGGDSLGKITSTAVKGAIAVGLTIGTLALASKIFGGNK